MDVDSSKNRDVREKKEEQKNLPPLHDKRILSRHQLVRNHQLPPRRETPPAGAEGLVQDPSVLDLGQVHDPVGLDLDVARVEVPHQHRRRLGGEGVRGEPVEGGGPVYGVTVSVPIFASEIAITAR